MNNHIDNGGSVNHIPNGNVLVGYRSNIGENNANHIENRNMNHSNMNDTPTSNVSIGDRFDSGDSNVSHIGNRNPNQFGNGCESISDRLARVGNTLDKGKQFFLFFERYRFILLNGR